MLNRDNLTHRNYRSISIYIVYEAGNNREFIVQRIRGENVNLARVSKFKFRAKTSRVFLSPPALIILSIFSCLIYFKYIYI